MIPRTGYAQRVRALLRQYPVVCLLGARQVGKTTLARSIASRGPAANFYDLEDSDQLARLADPLLELRRRSGLIVLDEVQRRPELFPALRVLADERPRRRRFLLLGSASPALLKQSSESLAGRIAYLEVGGLNLAEMPRARWERVWLRGGFPHSLLAPDDFASFDWRRRFRQTFVERDLPALELPNTPPGATLSRYWAMLAHVHGELLNWSELGRSMGVSDFSARRYADLLHGTLMVRLLQPWHENISKRQVKAPKLFFRDSGLLHVQLGIETIDALLQHPKAGASWEGFIIEQLLTLARVEPEECFFWRTEHGAELDLLIVRRGQKIGIEVKRTGAPSLTPSMRNALEDLKLDALYVVHAGEHGFSLGPSVEAVPWKRLGALATRLGRR